MGGKRSVRALRQRKITPTVPVLSTKITDSIPEAVARAAGGEQNPDMLKLQSTFLDMYSASDHKVAIFTSSLIFWL